MSICDAKTALEDSHRDGPIVAVNSCCAVLLPFTKHPIALCIVLLHHYPTKSRLDKASRYFFHDLCAGAIFQKVIGLVEAKDVCGIVCV